MGITYTALRLGNDARADLEAIEADAFVDSNAMHLCIPERVALQLQLKDTGIREVTLADGHDQQVRYVSPVRIEMLNRVCVTGALVLGDQVLLGVIPLQDMDLIVDPARQRVTVNPRSPNIPMSGHPETPVFAEKNLHKPLILREPIFLTEVFRGARTLICKAITRAHEQVILVGDGEAIQRAVKDAPRTHERHVTLGSLLRRGI